MGRTTLNPNQVNQEGLEQEEKLAINNLKAVDPFAEVQLFNEKGLVTPEGLNQLIDAAETCTVAFNTLHLELHNSELINAVNSLKEEIGRVGNPQAQETVVAFVELVHSIIHEIDRAKKS